jgi:hypothetical protein
MEYEEVQSNEALRYHEELYRIGQKFGVTSTVVEGILNEIAERQDSQALPEGIVLAPHYRGYAHLGTGQYLINHSAIGEPAALVISIATEEEKAGRKVGEDMPNPADKPIQPEDMAVLLRFENAAGLDALEKRLQLLRADHFPGSSHALPEQPSKYDQVFLDRGMTPPSPTQAAEPIWCPECGDGITAHDPGCCGNCLAMKYEPRRAAAEPSDDAKAALFNADQMRAYAEAAIKQEREQSYKLADALEELLSDTQHAKHESCTDGGYCPVRDAREALEGFRARSEAKE